MYFEGDIVRIKEFDRREWGAYPCTVCGYMATLSGKCFTIRYVRKRRFENKEHYDRVVKLLKTTYKYFNGDTHWYLLKGIGGYNWSSSMFELVKRTNFIDLNYVQDWR